MKFQELWSHDQTYLDKLKVGIYPPRSSQQLIRGLCCTPVRSKAQSARGEPSQQLLSAGLPGLPHPQGSELRPHPGADLRPAEAQQLSRSCAGEQRLRAALQGCSTACCAQRANGRTQSQQRGARGQSRVGGLLGAQRLQCDRVWGNKGGNAASPLTQTGMGSRPSAPELQAERLHSMPTLPKTAGRRDRLFAINCFYCCGKWNVSLTETSMPTKNTFITKRGNQSAELIERLATMWQQQPCFSVIANSS